MSVDATENTENLIPEAVKNYIIWLFTCTRIRYLREFPGYNKGIMCQ